MKKLFLTGLFAIGGLAAYAQTYNYSNATGWLSYTGFYDVSNANLSCGLSPLASNGTTGSISINTTAGEVQYNEVRGGHENRISVYLGNLYDQQFALDFDFRATSTTSGKAIYLAALTSQNSNPQLALPMTTCAAPANMDELGVKLVTTDPGSPAGLYVAVSVYDNGTNLSPSNTISVSYATTYYARLRVYGNRRGELFIYSNSTRTALVGSFCLEVPYTINGLRFLQHATISLAGPTRKTTAIVDNTSVYKVAEPCCILTWNGAINLFGTRYDAGEFTLAGDDVREKQVDLDEYGDVVYDFVQETGALTVTDWGEVDASTQLKQVVIRGTGKCRCEDLATIKDVYVGPFSTKSAPISDMPTANASDEMLHIFPNPASGNIVVEHDEAIREMVLLNAEGAVLETKTMEEAQKSVVLDLSARAAGIYLIRVTTASGTMVEQIIKK